MIDGDPQHRQTVRVCRVDRGVADLDVDGTTVSVPSTGTDLLVGDRVAIHAWTDGVPSFTVLPRHSVLSRQTADRTSREQHLVANVDVVMVVEPVAPRPSLGRIERMLVLAWSSGASPLVVLTKCDLCDTLDVTLAQVSSSAPGADVLAVSARTGQGMAELRAHLGEGRTFVLLGPSGAGKSTLVNALAGDHLLPTGEVRPDGRGRHTTSHRQLVTLQDGSLLIDTPGLRAVGVVGDESAVDEAFGDIVSLAVDCRFRDCGHQHEPGCEVTAAVADGRLPERRLSSWRALQREISYQQRRGDARLQREERARWRSLTKSMRGQSRP